MRSFTIRIIAIVLLAFAGSLYAETISLAVPGGTRALALAARMNPDTPPELFTMEYAQTLLRKRQGSEWVDFSKRIHLYFQTWSDLRKRMRTVPDGFAATLSVATFSDFYKTKDLLKLLGWTCDGEVVGDVSSPRLGKVSISPSAAPQDFERQSFSAGFGIDFNALKIAMASKQPFEIVLGSTAVPTELGEKFWSPFMNIKGNSGGLLEAFIDRPEIARLYVAMASIDADVRQELLSTFPAAQLASRYSDLLALYGSSLTITTGALQVPGGIDGAEAWSRLLGEPLDHPGRCIRALLERDHGKMFAYYHTLSELPGDNQKFFVRTADRLNLFYQSFPFSDKDLIERHVLIQRDTLFYDIAREFAVNENGDVTFPGGASVWTSDAKNSSNAFLLNLLATKDSRFLDLLRLSRQRYPSMDAPTAQVLLANYSKYSALFPYLGRLPQLTSTQLEAFFTAASAVDRASRVGRQTGENAMAQFHGVVSLLAILHENGSLSGAEVSQILEAFCNKLAASVNAQASITAIQEMVRALAARSQGSADDLLIGAMTGHSPIVQWQHGDHPVTVNRSDWQAERIHKILAAQKITSLQDLLARMNAAPVAPLDDKELATTLVAFSYAYYSAPDDLALADDPDFVRRHQFMGEGGSALWSEAVMTNCNDGHGGVCVSGGLANLAIAAGKWGRIKTESDHSLTGGAVVDPAAEAQLAAIRNGAWQRLTVKQFETLGKQVHDGKELIRRSASNPSVRKTVANRLLGVVGSFRRSEILRSLDAGDATGALELLTAAELKSLGTDSDVPEKSAYGPCEEYASLPRLEPLWNCVADSLLPSIAAASYEEQIPLDVVATISEPILRNIWKNVKMRDANDWLGVVREMNRIKLTDALEN